MPGEDNKLTARGCNMARSELENSVMATLAETGWSDDARLIGAVGAWKAAYGLPFHDKGNGAGRRTILTDGFRAGPSGRFDFLSVKGHSETGRPVPSKVALCTGDHSTIAAIVAAAERGGAMPVLVVSNAGYARTFDAAPIIRANREHILAAPRSWERGTAPGAYCALVTRSGGKYCYPCLTISFTGAGDAAGEWVRANMADLPALVERAFDWSASGHSFIY